MKNVFLAFTAFLSVYILCGCNKETPISKDVDPKTEICNPFDFVGEMHNTGLDAVLSALPKTKSMNISTEEIEKLTNDFCEKVFAEDERFSIIPYTKADIEHDSTCECEIVLSDEASAYCDKIINVAATNDYEYIKEQFALFEEDIILNKPLIFSEYEKKFVAMFFSCREI